MDVGNVVGQTRVLCQVLLQPEEICLGRDGGLMRCVSASRSLWVLGG